jgi:hypothetical protein
MGIIRKTMSLSTLGAVDFRSDKERIARSTRQTANATRRLVQVEERRDAATGIAPLSGRLNSPFSGRNPSHPSAGEIAAGAPANDLLAAQTETQRLLREQNELLRRSMLTPEQREAEDAAKAAAEQAGAEQAAIAAAAEAEQAAITRETSDLRAFIAAGFAAWCRAQPRAVKIEFAQQQCYSLPRFGDVDKALCEHNRTYLRALSLEQLRALDGATRGAGPTSQLMSGEGAGSES